MCQCERAFSIQNCTRTKTRNKLDTKYLECIMRVSMDDLCDDLDNVLMEAMGPFTVGVVLLDV